MNLNDKTTPEWLWWCFRFGIGLAAILLACALTAFLLYRLVKLIRWARLPKEERTRQKDGHLMARISGRGRAAYLILCLENALTHFDLPAASWEWVLQRLWVLTEAPETQHQRLFDVCCLLPENVLPYERYEDLTAHGLSDALLALWDAEGGLPEERFQPLRDLYTETGWRLRVLGPLLSAVYLLAALSWPKAEKEDAQGLALIRRMETLMQNWSIPLPQGAGLAAIQKERYPGWGPVFHGVRLSSLLTVRTPEEAATAELARKSAAPESEEPPLQ